MSACRAADRMDRDGHGAELDGTCADDGCCKEGEEHGDSFHGLVGTEKRKPRASEDGQGFQEGYDAFRLLSP